MEARLRVLGFWMAGSLLLAAERAPLASDETVNRIAEGIKDAQLSVGDLSSPQREAIRRRALDGLNDEQRIRGIAEWMFRHPMHGHSSIPSTAMQVLLSPRREIQDLGELRRLMNAETDSNRFYMLSALAQYFEAPKFGYGESFMTERSRGLLMHGPAATEGLGSSAYRLSDISLYSYDSIIDDLKKVDSPFITEVLPTLAGKPEAAKVMALAKWLKSNCPGCEGLKVFGSQDTRPDLKVIALKERRNGGDGTENTLDTPAAGGASHQSPLYAIVVAALAVMVSLVWYFAKARSHKGE